MRKAFIFILGIIFFSLVNLSSVYAISITANIPEKYQEVYPGERLYFEIAVKYPENPTRVDLRLNYIIEKDGEVVTRSKALKAVETQASFLDYIIIPEGSPSSFHDLKIEVRDYGDLEEDVSTGFKLAEKGLDRIAKYFFITIGGMVFLGILVMVDIFRRKK
ncbi:hypothetical protein KAS08_02190 [Candidatus Pacearchaeota archaeon]|nr:hypothetical protein [Candidatus Pacearchaeota archaeon]